VVVKRRIRIGEFARRQFGWELEFVAWDEANRGIEPMAQVGLCPGQNVKKFVGEHPRQVGPRFLQFRFGEDDGVGAGVGGVASEEQEVHRGVAGWRRQWQWGIDAPILG
jgi:hypothetical protein